MSTDVIDEYVETPEEMEAERLYNTGYDDGYNGKAKRDSNPDYLDGWYAGDEDAEDSDDYYSYDATYWSFSDDDED
jgi:hypothetical protein